MTAPAQNRQPHEVAIREWVASVLTGYTVIWSGQDTHVPPEPFASVTMLSDRRTGHPSVEWTEEPGDTDPAKIKVYTTTPRAGTFSVSLYGPNHRENAVDLEDSIFDQASLDQWAVANIAITQALGPIVHSRDVRETAMRDWTPIDFDFRYQRVRVQEVDYLETVEVTGNPPPLDCVNESITQ